MYNGIYAVSNRIADGGWKARDLLLSGFHAIDLWFEKSMKNKKTLKIPQKVNWKNLKHDFSFTGNKVQHFCSGLPTQTVVLLFKM